MPQPAPADPESLRLNEFVQGYHPWKEWGPYLSERQWGTVREDYSPDGNPWDYFPHSQATSRAYRWGEDGLMGICDSRGLLCFAPALWNGKDPILKERLFGLNNHEGNHGEDVKECYYYLSSTPTHSYMKSLYKYPQAAFPYGLLVSENGRRGRNDPEFELLDTGIFNDNRYFDVLMEYAKAGPEDILIRVTAVNRGPAEAELHLLATLWFRNTWSWGRTSEGYWPEPTLAPSQGGILARHPLLGGMVLRAEKPPGPDGPQLLFTDNETNSEKLFHSPNRSDFVKDAFHDYVVEGKKEKANASGGTKAAFYHRFKVAAGGQKVLKWRLSKAGQDQPFGTDFDRVFEKRIQESKAFYDLKIPAGLSPEERLVAEQAYAGLLWSKQYYLYHVKEWLEGDPSQPPVPPDRQYGRNHDWTHFGAEDVLSMPDKWEYPWFAAWDLAFHTVCFAELDPFIAKHQLVLMLREWYMQPNGQIPAYEFAFSDVNPPLFAWAAWEVYSRSGSQGEGDRLFLSRVFQKLLLNFTWWVNRKDTEGNNLFSGGFLGLDNIGVLDRRQLKPGEVLEQADGTAWMACYCGTLLTMALELSKGNPGTEDMATKFFEHYICIVDAINSQGGMGLWDEKDGFYYDQVLHNGAVSPLRVRSAVGIIPLFAAEVLEEAELEKLPEFNKRLGWFIENRPELAGNFLQRDGRPPGKGKILLAVPSRERLGRVLSVVLDEKEFLSPYGIRALSKLHQDHPFVLDLDGTRHEVNYEPGESTSGFFGGNSNWRGPVWLPLNFLLVEALERYHSFYGDRFKIECPTGSGEWMNLLEVARFLAGRLALLFLPDAKGNRPAHGGEPRYARDPAWKDLILFYEYFHGDNGKGLGASHQTGWTTLIAKLLEGKA
jgi:hypothetical protein